MFIAQQSEHERNCHESLERPIGARYLLLGPIGEGLDSLLITALQE